MLYEANAGMGMASGPGRQYEQGILSGLGRAWSGCPQGYSLDPVTARCFPSGMNGLGMATGGGRAYREGIFSAFGADAGNYFNLESPAGLRQFKKALRYLKSSLPAASIDLDFWDEGTEAQFKLFIEGLQNPAVLGTQVNGHLVPTKTGALTVANAAITAAGDAYAKQYWPDLYTWAKGFDPQFVPPSNFGGTSTATMLMWVGGAGVALVLLAVALSSKKRRSRR